LHVYPLNIAETTQWITRPFETLALGLIDALARRGPGIANRVPHSCGIRTGSSTSRRMRMAGRRELFVLDFQLLFHGQSMRGR